MWDFTNDKTGRELLPQGMYNVVVDSFEEKQSSTGNMALILKFIVTEGEHAGRVVYNRYSLTGSEKAVQISRGQLKSLLVAANKPTQITGAHDFVGCEVTASVKIQSSPGYEDKNVISYVKPLVAATPKQDVPF
jgi:hypothetical protein